jgi:hypothetical protein
MVMTAVSAILPPSQVSVRLADDDGQILHAKCAVIDRRSFARETSRARHDHFCLGRLFQPSEVAYARDAAAAEALLDALVSAHRETYGWVRPWLPASFDAEAYCRTLLEVSLSREIRPEPAGRAEALFAAQREEAVPSTIACSRSRVQASCSAPGYTLADGGPLRRARLHLYFARSLARRPWWGLRGHLRRLARLHRPHPTPRGGPIDLSPRERRLPLLSFGPASSGIFGTRIAEGRPWT